MNNKDNMKEVPMVTLDDLVAGITNHNKLLTAQAEIKNLQNEVSVYKTHIEHLEKAGNNLALLMLNGTTSEIRQSLAEWRRLVAIRNANQESR
jgi:hypothetical protein